MKAPTHKHNITQAPTTDPHNGIWAESIQIEKNSQKGYQLNPQVTQVN